MAVAKGVGVSARKAMLADALSEDGAEPMDVESPEPGGFKAEPVRVPAVVPVPAPAGDSAALISMLVQALTQSSASNADAIKSALGEASALARDPIPENKVAPGISVYSHPLGDATHPRTKLRCPMFLGVFDEDGKTTPAFEIHEDTCTEQERELLNSLKTGQYPVERNDGKSALWRVAEKLDDLGQPVRLVIAVPQTWLSKDEQAQMPSQVKFLQQLVSAA